MLRIITMTFVAITLFFSCSQKEEKLSDNKQINYGTSFGFCVGLCNEDIYINSKTTTYTNFGNDFNNDTVETITCKSETVKEDWDKLEDLLIPSDFFSLKKSHGCPDCADGGSEWVELILEDGSSHKVTFEYENAPEEMKSYVNVLREISDTKAAQCKKE